MSAVRNALLERIEQETKENPALEQEIGGVIRGYLDIIHEINKNLADAFEAAGIDTKKAGVTIPDVVPKKETWRQRSEEIAGKLHGLSASQRLKELLADYIEESTETYRKAAKPYKDKDIQYTPMEQAIESTPTKPIIPFTYGPDWHGRVEVLDNAAMAITMMGLSAGGRYFKLIPNGWKLNQHDGTPYLDKLNWRHGGDWRINIDAATGDATELWATVERYGTLHMQVLLYCLAKMGEPRNRAYYPLLEPVTIEIEKILDDKNIKRQGKNREQMREKVAQCLKDLSGIRLTVRNATLNGRPVALKNVALLEIAEVYGEQLCLSWEEFDRVFTDKLPIGWAVRAGMWASYLYKDNETRGFVSELSKLYLELESRPDRLCDLIAFRIGILLFTVAADGKDNKQRAKVMSVAALLQDIYLFLEEQNRPKDWANRMDTALMEALEKLKECGRLAAYHIGATYPDPGNRGRGWVPDWLKTELTLVTPTAAEALGTLARPVTKKKPTVRRRRGPAQPEERLDVATCTAIKAKLGRLDTRGWKQKTLARHLKVSEAYMTYLLKGERAPSADLAARLQDWLTNYPED